MMKNNQWIYFFFFKLFDKVYYSTGERKAAVSAIKLGLQENLVANGVAADLAKKITYKLVEPAVEAEVTRAILEDGKRVDGRALDQIRDLKAEVSLWARDHGTS